MEVTPTSANVMEYVRIVQDKSLMRQVAQAAGSITAMVQEGGGAAGDMLEAAEQQIYAIRRGRSAQGMVTVGMVLGDVMSQLAELSANGGRTVPGLSTGLSAVDAKINGMNKSDLLLLAARPGMGKTSMALNVALSAARESGKTVAIFSLEMSKEQLVPPHRQRGPGGEPALDHRQPAGERLAAHRRGRLRPQPHGHPYR